MKTTNNEFIAKELITITKQLLVESGVTYNRDIQLSDSLQRHLGIDSLGRAELFQRIEKSFSVSLPDKLLAEAETLNDIALYLQTAETTSTFTAQEKLIITPHNERSYVNPNKAETLIDLLFLYAEHSPNKAHIYFQNEEGREEIITYGQLLNESLIIAAGLRERGLKEGETVAIMQPTHPGFFYTFLGTLLAGGVPVPIYPPFRAHMLESYAKTEARILSNAEVRILVTFERAEKLSHLLKAFVPSLRVVTTVKELQNKDKLQNPFKATNDNYAFIQYTSGSTSDPKGVLLSHYNLLSNIRAYGKAVNITPDDVAISWLPLYHDMGLIGMWLGSLHFGIPLVLLTPFSFLNHPEKWLWAFHRHRGTVSGAPNFAYELCVRKIDLSMLEGLDLSSWRLAANGAEKVYPRTLEQFAEKFAPFGFKRSALLPVYGLAESTVALAIPPMDREFLVDRVDRKKFEEERQAIPSSNKSDLAFVACGRAIENHEMRVVNDEGEVLPERHVGNLQFRGPSSMQGYFNNPRATEAVKHEDGWVDSGDLAYLVNEEVYITGRRKDLIIKAGRNLYPAEIEELVGALPNVRQGCVAAFGITDNVRGTEQLVVVAETREKDKTKLAAIIDSIRDAMSSTLDITADDIVLVGPRTVPKTSSGKLQRAACKRMYMENRLGKFQIPAWMQVSKLSLEWFSRKINYYAKQFIKAIYTAYLASIILLGYLAVVIISLFANRNTLAHSIKIWAQSVLLLSFCPIKKIGFENLHKKRPVIYAANHASYIDVVVALSVMPIETRFIGKKELFTAPFIGFLMRKLDYISVDRLDLAKSMQDTQQIESVLKNNYPVFIFPEGTFSYALGLRPFRLGAFKIASETSVPVCPIALHGTRFILRDDAKLITPGSIEITVSEPINATGKEWQDVIQLREAVRAEIAKYCGEPSLDYIAAQTVAPKLPKS